MTKYAYKYFSLLTVLIFIIIVVAITAKKNDSISTVNSVYVDTITYVNVIDSINLQIHYKDSIVKQIKIDMANEKEKVLHDNDSDAYELFIELSSSSE